MTLQTDGQGYHNNTFFKKRRDNKSFEKLSQLTQHVHKIPKPENPRASSQKMLKKSLDNVFLEN